jgi:LysR family transcriptional regulator, glycine cleavage system transcriptional activator
LASRPPLNALFVFCEVARCGSFKRAAQTLCVTPGAVSRQIQALEESLGQTLFDRSPRATGLTRKGQWLFDRVAHKMASIQSEADLMRSGGRRAVVRVDAGVTLAMHWLIPRLSRFADKHPDIQVQITTSDGPIALNQAVDVFVRRDPAELRGLPSQVFVEEFSVLVGSPGLVKSKSRLTSKEIARLPRIAARSRPDLWPQWCAHHGFEEADYRPTLEFDNTVLAIQATSQALGVMVVPTLFIGGALDSRLLVAMEPARIRTGSYSYATRARRDARRVVAFTDWLRGTVRLPT